MGRTWTLNAFQQTNIWFCLKTCKNINYFSCCQAFYFSSAQRNSLLFYVHLVLIRLFERAKKFICVLFLDPHLFSETRCIVLADFLVPFFNKINYSAVFCAIFGVLCTSDAHSCASKGKTEKFFLHLLAYTHFSDILKQI